MQNRISKDNFAEIAQHAVTSIRRLVGSSHYERLSPSQHDLLSCCKQIEDAWRKNKAAVDASVVNAWVSSFVDELVFYFNSNEKDEPCKPISESAMLMALETARIVCHTNAFSNCTFLTIRSLVLVLVRYFMEIPLTKRLRDTLALVLVEMFEKQIAPLDELLEDILSFLVTSLPIPNQASRSVEQETEPVDKPEESTRTPDTASEIGPMQVYMASLLVEVLHRTSSLDLDLVTSVRVTKHRVESIITLLQSAYHIRCKALPSMEQDTDACSSLMEEDYQVAVCTVFLSLISGLLRGNASCKEAIIAGYGYEFSSTWVFAASRLSHMKLELTVPAPTPKDNLVALDATQIWHSELLELLIEVCSEGSFSLRRMSFSIAIEDDRLKGISNPLNKDGPGSPRGPSTAMLSSSKRHYNPIPLYWDTILTGGGSTWVWKLASSLCGCVFTWKGIDVLELCLLGLDIRSVVVESMLKGLITTLLLMCFANPYNTKRLAEKKMFECLFAMLTNDQDSVFERAVCINVTKGGGGDESSVDNSVSVSPSSVMPTASATHLLEAFMSSLASFCFPKRILHLLMQGVKDMYTAPFSQIDVEIEESLLNVLNCTCAPPHVLFFPGNGSVRCKLSQFIGRWSGYSFSAWVHPLCVWPEGSHLFSYTLTYGTSVSINVVANGCSCFLAVRVQTSKESTVSVVPESTFNAETWSHIAFTHELSVMTFYVNGRKLSTGLSVPFPKDNFERHKLDLAFGGIMDEPSFFGYVTSMSIIEGVVGEKDMAKIYTQGPSPSEGAELGILLSVRAIKQLAPPANAPIAGNDSESTAKPYLDIKGTLYSKCDSMSVHNVFSITTHSVQDDIKDCAIMPWALQTLKDSHRSPNFNTIAKLCLEFISVAMRTSNTDEDLNAILKDSYLASLGAEILTWTDTFTELPAILLLSATLRGSSRTLRSHQSTQDIFSILLERLEAVCRAKEGDAIVRNPASTAIILRELSDYLSTSGNVKLFKEVPGRFQRILLISLDLPPECIEAVVVLIEKLCKGVQELEHTLRFLLLPQPSRPNADTVKAGILRMLFDVARTNEMMCDWIGACFKNCGASFLILLVDGKNHSSEAIRVFSLLLLSLMLHMNRKFREAFVKANRFDVLSYAITNPSSTVPIRLPTLECLFQMVFQEYHHPTKNNDGNIASLLCETNLAKHTAAPKSDMTSILSNGVPKKLNLAGHSPGLVSRLLRVTRREYSFDLAHEFGRVGSSLQLDDCFRNKSTANPSLRMLQAFKTALQVLRSLILAIGSTPYPTAVSGCELDLPHSSPIARQESSPIYSPLSSSNEEESMERVVVQVLSYLENIIDMHKNGEALLVCPWLEWFWDAIEPVVSSRRSHSDTGAAVMNIGTHWTKKFSSTVVTHTRHIIRKMLVLDMTHNSKAATVRRIRGGGVQSPLLIRIILEEVMRYFSKCELLNPEHARNVIKNINYLLLNVEHMLDPFPTTLGIEIVVSISAIAVRNNSWVRMHMKKSTQLFDTRDRLAFYLLCMARRYAKIDMELLRQLMDANAHNPNSMCVLLKCFVCAIKQKDVDELEIILQLIHHLVSANEGQRWQVYTLVGTSNAKLGELFCSANEGTGPFANLKVAHVRLGQIQFSTSRNGSSGVLSEGVLSRSSNAEVDRNTPCTEPIIEGPPLLQIIGWCQTHGAEWASFAQQVEHKAAKLIDALLKSIRDRSEKERALVLKASRAQKERYEQAKITAIQELRSMRAEVEADLSIGT